MAVTVQEAIRRLDSFVSYLPSAALTSLGDSVEAIKTVMQEPGEEVSYPINWDSERQRKAYFSTDGFGHGIPYVRTGEHEAAWEAKQITDGYELSNPDPAAAISGYYSGEQWQSSIHRGRWKHIATAVATEMAKLPVSLLEKITIAWNRMTK
jgi:hypothetical protein